MGLLFYVLICNLRNEQKKEGQRNLTHIKTTSIKNPIWEPQENIDIPELWENYFDLRVEKTPKN